MRKPFGLVNIFEYVNRENWDRIKYFLNLDIEETEETKSFDIICTIIDYDNEERLYILSCASLDSAIEAKHALETVLKRRFEFVSCDYSDYSKEDLTPEFMKMLDRKRELQKLIKEKEQRLYYQ